jgi:copper chaperone
MIHYEVPAMTCGGCARAITRAIQSIDPEARVETNVDAKRVSVASKADGAKLTTALTEAGYPPVRLAT